MIDVAAALYGSTAPGRMLDRHGAVAQAWLDRLPALVEELCLRWRLRTTAMLAGGTSVVLRCLREEGSGAFLKVVPHVEIARIEAVALRAWDRHSGVVGLLDVDPDRGALLLEAIEPGLALSERDGTMPWDAVTVLLRQLPVGPPPGALLPSLVERVDAGFRLWTRRRARLETDLLDAATMARSHSYALELAASGPIRLLHGDLHPGNVLDGGRSRGLVAIDPRPCLGDPNFDGVDWVHVGLDDAGQVVGRTRMLAGRVPHFDIARLVEWSRATAAMPAVAHLLADRPGQARPLLALAHSVP
ncbi:MAG: aminoglycoside phosphotransferase family protein [Pseudonocardiales bacterium]